MSTFFTVPTNLTSSTETRLRCSLARDLEMAGDLPEAVKTLGSLWLGVGVRPLTKGLEQSAAADLLLRVGSLTSLSGKKLRILGAQESAKNLLSESARIFAEVGLHDKYAEAQIALAYCYWSEGASVEARDVLSDALESADALEPDVQALGVIRLAIAEMTLGNPEGALHTLTGRQNIFFSCTIPLLRARFQNELGLVYYYMLTERNRIELASCAILSLQNASRMYMECGSLQDYSLAENNLGLTFSCLSRFAEAHEHLDLAISASNESNDSYSRFVATESRAQVLIRQGEYEHAAAVICGNIEALEQCDNQRLLAESLITYGVALYRLKRIADAEKVFDRASEVAELAGDAANVKLALEIRKREMSSNVIDIGEARRQRKAGFSWRMPDDSLMQAGVSKGDAVTFVPCSTWEDGDLVAVEVPGGRFVKFIYGEGPSLVRLEGAHPRCRDRRYPRQQIRVIGVAVTHECS